MSVHRPKIISPLPKPLDKFSPRELRWLWYYLDGYRKLDEGKRTSPPYASLSQSERLRMMNNAIRSDRYLDRLVNRIIFCCKDDLIPEEDLKWIDKKNHRLLIWCLNNLNRPIPNTFHTSLVLPKRRPKMPHLDTFAAIRHEEIMTSIDIWPINREGKINFLLEKKNEWAHHKTHDKQIKWINQKDEVQLVWAWEYLENHRKALRIPKPADLMEYHAAVLASLDDMSYSHPAEKKLFMEQMKKTWSQKKYRDSGKAKKPYNLPLTIQTKKKLDWLAENSGQKPTEILEQLIEESYSKAKQGE